MNREAFQALFSKGILILDGATGTQMMKRGMPAGVCPEQWALEHPDALLSVQRAYVAAGSQVVYTFTFGGSRFKLKKHGLADRTREMNAALARLSREAAGSEVLVAGDLAPCGRMLLPYGDASFEEVVDGFREQVLGLLEGGVDFFVVETMMDIQEARAAMIAVRACCDLPILATMTFESGMHTLTGTDPVSALVTLQALGADAVGTNCSTGPAEMVEVIRAMKPHARVPLVAKANAGKPRLVDGKTVFDMDAGQYAAFVGTLVEAGVNALGGCCGTDPGFISKMAGQAFGILPVPSSTAQEGIASSARQSIRIAPGLPPVMAGMRLLPAGNDKLRGYLEGNDMDEIFDLAREQMEEGAAILHLGAEVEGLNESALLFDMVQTLIQAVPLPLCFHASSAEALETALRIYPGRAVVALDPRNPVHAAAALPVAARYGAMIWLPNDMPADKESPAGMTRLSEVIGTALRHYGYQPWDVLTDTPDRSAEEPGLRQVVIADPVWYTVGVAR